MNVGGSINVGSGGGGGGGGMEVASVAEVSVQPDEELLYSTGITSRNPEGKGIGCNAWFAGDQSISGVKLAESETTESGVVSYRLLWYDFYGEYSFEIRNNADTAVDVMAAAYLFPVPDDAPQMELLG